MSNQHEDEKSVPTSIREKIRLGVHRGLAPRWMTLLPAIGETQADYERFLAEVADGVLDALGHDCPESDYLTELNNRAEENGLEIIEPTRGVS